jgi:hypothetical protein
MSDYSTVALTNNGTTTYLRLYDSATGEQFEIGPSMEVHVYLTEQGGIDFMEVLDSLLEEELLPEFPEELPGGYVSMADEEYDDV